jgi:hypothetical protein
MWPAPPSTPGTNSLRCGWWSPVELRTHVEEYLRVRRGLGFKLEDHDRLLSAFIDHLEVHLGIDTDRRGRAAVGHRSSWSEVL